MATARKYIVLLRRPREMDATEFHERWSAEGAKLASHRPPGLAGYVQNPTRAGAYRSGNPAFDGYAELWLNTEGPVLNTPLEQDCEAVCLAAETYVIRSGDVPGAAVKSIELIRRRQDMAPTDFRGYWRENHGPLACGIPFLRYEQNHVRTDANLASPFDGAAITWFTTMDDMRATVRTIAYERTRADEPNFLLLPSLVLLTDTRVLVPFD